MSNNVFSKAVWISPEKFSSLEIRDLLCKEIDAKSKTPVEGVQNLHFYFKKNINIDNTRGVKIRISADDYYKLYVNGNFVGQGPAQGYPFNYYFNEYDLSELLREGENEIFVHCYYQGLINRYYMSGDGRLGMIAEIYSDSGIISATDTSWAASVSDAYSITHINGYNTDFAENFDNRKSCLSWKRAAVREMDHVFEGKAITPLAVYKKDAAETKILSDGSLFLDFGTEITASLEFEADGDDGDRVILHFGEELCDDGSVRYLMRSICNYEDTVILKGGENRISQYEYKAFRYVNIIPCGNAKIVGARAIVRHYPFDDEYCNIETDNKILEAVFNICKNTIKYGAQEVYVDCPGREKGQYAGDLTITGGSHVLLTGDMSLYTKAIDNQAQSQAICDGLMAVTPGSHMQEIADYSLQFPLLAIRHYRHTKDREYLLRNYHVSERIIGYFSKFAREDGLLEDVTDKWNLVDWPQNLRDGYDFPLTNPLEKGHGPHNVLNAFYIGCIKQVELIASILGLERENMSEALKESFKKEFYRPDLGVFVDRKGSDHSAVHSNILPLYFALTDEENEEIITDHLVSRGNCTGVYMSYFLLKALCRVGRYEDALAIITSESERSWYNMIREGGTTCFEAWGKEQKWNTSLCHPWATAPISVIIKDIVPNMPHVAKIIYKNK